MTTPDNIRKQFPKELYDEHNFSFTRSELTSISPYDVFNTMAQFAQAVIESILDKIQRERLKLRTGPGTGRIYDITMGSLVVFTPKNWCSNCDKAAGMLTEEGIYLCQSCSVLRKIQKENNVVDRK